MNKKGFGAIVVVGIVLISIVSTLILSKISFESWVDNLSGKNKRESDNLLVFGGHSSPFEEGITNARDKCLESFRMKNIPSNAACNSGGGITSPNTQGVCAVRLLSEEESGRRNAQGAREPGYAAGYCCGKSFLPEICEEPLVGTMV